MDAARTQIDLKRLAAEVSVQHGIRVDPDDPMMAVVTLNRLVFEQAVGQLLERVGIVELLQRIGIRQLLQHVRTGQLLYS